ncbi:hypothetical protein BTO06_01000 [Tenacibaculum sp. SZ-18]|uniref:HNH endonuclease signature motif containing protein n=1 Tax=Tenacibaculum sp. SZ-18 TaxID=754423 RepID=UPI000CA38D84|nr:HNH endonuclease signature motif containing protein [Tenacibaculum sp. SZ-18]AUC13811.1 hypothetical protein BTO06_01000 [Tenacibaculum sp. SZ-18]
MPFKPQPKRKPWQEKRVPHGRRLNDNSKFYNSRAWRNFRKQVLIEEPLCRLCSSKGLVKEAKVVDHIVRIVDGGEKLSRSNVQPLCSKCHNSKSGKEAHGYKQDK